MPRQPIPYTLYLIPYTALLFILGTLLIVPIFFAHAATIVEQGKDASKQLEEKRAEIQKLEAQIEQYRKDISEKQKDAKTAQSKINVLLSQIKKLNLEITLLNKAREETALSIRETEQTIQSLRERIQSKKIQLAEYIRILDRKEQEHSFLIVFFERERLSDVIDEIEALLTIQKTTKETYQELTQLREEEEVQKQSLEEQHAEQVQLLTAQSIQRNEILLKEKEHERILNETKKKEQELRGLLQLSQTTIEKLKNEIYGLQRIGVTVEDAVRIGQLVAERTGIRAGFLIAVLEIESRLGLNVGTGTWKKDMNPNQHDAFLKITKELGLDPDTTPVSKKPSYGWGGAMGPAQFIPTTWLGYRDEVARLTGHALPNPWNIEDAFMASGIMLSRNGANEKTRSAELRAAKTYISGNPNCTKNICNYYSNLVLDKADEIEQTLKDN